MSRQPLALTLWFLSPIVGAGCFAPSVEPTPPSYHNPLDLLDGGEPHGDGGHSPDAGPSRSIGTVEGHSPNLFAATYHVDIDDAGAGRTSIYLADVADLCAAIASDAGLGATWNLVRFRVDGDEANAYPVAPVLPPSGAIAEFDYQDDAGGFGIVAASGGSLQLDSVDPNNVQPTIGTYTLSFSGTDSLTGTFVAGPCALAPAPPEG
jgi:hypothetical protein